MRRGLLFLAAIVALATIAGVTYAQVTGPTAVKNSFADESVPAASPSWFAWSQRPHRYRNRNNLYAEPTPVDGTDAFRVSEAGTRAWPGGIDGDTLVYQSAVSNQSNIRFVDLPSKTETPHPQINSTQWEWHPTISTLNAEQWVLFGRHNLSTGVERVLLHNLDTHETRTLATVRRRSYGVYAGQVSGNYATWHVCNPACNVRVYDITAGTTTTVPKPSATVHQYTPSVTDDGTVYFVRSGNGCGVNVRLMRYRDGVRQTLLSLSAGRDSFTTYASEEADGTHVYYDQVVCSTDRWNIFKIVDPPETP